MAFSIPFKSSVCPDFGVDVNETRAWCIEEGGLFLRSTLNGDILSMRLPILSDAGGFGTLPQMFFAFDGDASTLLVEQGTFGSGNVSNLFRHLKTPT